MSFEDAIRQIIREENKLHYQEIKELLESQSAPKDINYYNPNEATTLSVQEASEILGFGINKTYEMVKEHEKTGIPHLRVKGKIRIPRIALLNWINQQSRQAN